MLIKNFLILIIVLTLNLDALVLKNSYYIDGNDIYLSDIIKNVKNDKLLYKISPTEHKKKIRVKTLLALLKKYGYTNIRAKSTYISFDKKSPIDREKLIKFIKDYYKKNYSFIDIQDVKVEPRSYIDSLPTMYDIEIRDRNYLSKDGILDIKTPKNKKIFFNYTIKATLFIYISRYKIKKGDELTLLNTAKNSIILNRFRAKPIQSIDLVNLEAKHNIKKESVITIRDVKGLSLVKKNSLINVFIRNSNLSISFSAKALDNGRLGDSIRVQKSDKKRLKAVVVGKNIAEIR